MKIQTYCKSDNGVRLQNFDWETAPIVGDTIVLSSIQFRVVDRIFLTDPMPRLVLVIEKTTNPNVDDIVE